jgi:hypothetical protein
MSHTTTCKAVPIKSVNALRSAVAELQRAGINCELVANDIPRMYYRNQIKLHLKDKGAKFQYHDNPDECEFVLRLPDAYYDIGFLRDEKGFLQPVFDDYNYGSGAVSGGRQGIRALLGCKMDGVTQQHWAGQKEAGKNELASIGKLLQGYSKHAIMEQAASHGKTMKSCSTDPKTGALQMVFV